MERAPLRPIPARPAGPVDAVAAARALGELLPGLSPREAGAMALVALAGRSRGEAAAELGVVVSELAEGLATGRKALRRSLQPLSASGWCERAERLISDRLDDELDARGAARLDVHLRNCPRCVEHERRLVQATDALVAQAAGPGEIGPATPAVQLTVVAPTEPPQPAEPGPTPRQVARGVTWTLLAVAAVIVALAALALIVAGMLGASI
jgi:Putative zinc-finger